MYIGCAVRKNFRETLQNSHTNRKYSTFNSSAESSLHAGRYARKTCRIRQTNETEKQMKLKNYLAPYPDASGPALVIDDTKRQITESETLK
jgi:hypothetical protein